MEKLGDTFYASQKFKDAAPVYRRLVGIREKSLGANPLTLSALFKMAKVHERLGQSEEAEDHYKRGVALGEKVPGPLYANLCDAYSALLKRTNRDPQEALRLEQAAKQRRDRDGIAARVGEATLRMAAIQIPASESLEPEADEEETADDEEDDEEDAADEAATDDDEATNGEPAQTDEGDVHQAPAAGAFSLAELDAIKAPSAEAGAPQANPPGKSDILSRAPKSQAGGFLKRKTEEMSMPASPANQFSKNVLDSINPPEPKPQPFSLADLDAIPPGAPSAPAASAQPAAQPFSPDALDAIRTPGAASPPPPATMSGTTRGATTNSGATPPNQFDVSALDAIKAPSPSGLSKPAPPPAPPVKPEFTPRNLDAIKTPSTSISGERSPAFDDPGDRKSSRSMTRSDLPETSAGPNQAMIPAMVALVLIICCIGVVGFGMMSKSTGPNNVGLTPLAGKTFRTADRKQELNFTGVSKGQLTISGGEGTKKATYETQFVAYTGSPLEELQALTGAFDNDVWLQNHFLGFKSEDGAILYDPSAPEVSVIDEMWSIADAAQSFYRAHGRYPRHPAKDPGLLKSLNSKLSFVNGLNKQDVIPEIIMLKWPDDDVPNNVQTQSKLEKKWLDGQPFSDKRTLSGVIRCVQIGSPVLDSKLAEDCTIPGSQRIDEFMIEGYNRYNELIRGGNGKVFMIALKKGADMTPMTAPSLVRDGAKSPVTIVISESERPSKMSVVLKYLGMLAFFAVVIVVWLKWPTIVAKVRREETRAS